MLVYIADEKSCFPQIPRGNKGFPKNKQCIITAHSKLFSGDDDNVVVELLMAHRYYQCYFPSPPNCCPHPSSAIADSTYRNKHLQNVHQIRIS